MLVVNAMFSRGLGGIEQAFIDYCTALKHQGHDVIALVHPKAAVKKDLLRMTDGKHFIIREIGNAGQWDIWASGRARSLLRKKRPDVVIAHGNRAVTLLRKATSLICPLVGVTHNYSHKHLVGIDAVIAITKDLQRHIIEAGQPEDTVYIIPNMIHQRLRSGHPYHDPPVIGTMGRFVEKKGMDHFLEALAELASMDVLFKAVIGGSGEEEKKLKERCASLKLGQRVTFTGWVENKQDFFKSIDIFCLPSHHEPFGIVLLEAFNHHVPVITTDTEGPSEIVTHGENGLVVAKGDVIAMAKAIKRLTVQKNVANNLAEQAQKTLKQRYALEVVSKKLDKALEEIVRHYG